MGRLDSLVVTKTFKENDAERQKWAERRAEVGRLLDEFPQDDLRLLLGEKYEELVEMKQLLAPVVPAG